MKIITTASLLVILTATCSLTLIAQKKNSVLIKKIDAYARSLDSYGRRNSRSKLVFADVSEPGQEKPEWRRFPSSSSLEKHREDSDVYTIANVWRRNGKVVLAVMTFSSLSGDWAKYLSLYFRADGGLAKSDTEFRTFYGDLIIRQEFYFDTRRRLLKRTKDFFDLSTGEPKKPDGEFLGPQSGIYDEENYYLTVGKLPFAHLLKK